MDVDVVQGVAGVEAHAGLANQFSGAADFLQFLADGGAFGIAAAVEEGMGVRTGVNFADREAAGVGGFDLIFLGIDEGADGEAGVDQLGDNVLEAFALAVHVEAAFGGDFLTALGNEHHQLRLDVAGDLDHFIGRGHFEIEFDVGELDEAAHIIVLDVPTVFTQMHSDAVGPTEVGFDGGPDGVGLVGSPGLADGGDVVDVDAELDHGIQRSLKEPGTQAVRLSRAMRRFEAGCDPRLPRLENEDRWWWIEMGLVRRGVRGRLGDWLNRLA